MITKQVITEIQREVDQLFHRADNIIGQSLANAFALDNIDVEATKAKAAQVYIDLVSDLAKGNFVLKLYASQGVPIHITVDHPQDRIGSLAEALKFGWIPDTGDSYQRDGERLENAAENTEQEPSLRTVGNPPQSGVSTLDMREVVREVIDQTEQRRTAATVKDILMFRDPKSRELVAGRIIERPLTPNEDPTKFNLTKTTGEQEAERMRGDG